MHSLRRWLPYVNEKRNEYIYIIGYFDFHDNFIDNFLQHTKICFNQLVNSWD